jgi:hypothetical protein
VALDARFVEDRRDVLGERRCAIGCHRWRCRPCGNETQNQRETHGTLPVM